MRPTASRSIVETAQHDAEGCSPRAALDRGRRAMGPWLGAASHSRVGRTSLGIVLDVADQSNAAAFLTAQASVVAGLTTSRGLHDQGAPTTGTRYRQARHVSMLDVGRLSEWKGDIRISMRRMGLSGSDHVSLLRGDTTRRLK